MKNLSFLLLCAVLISMAASCDDDDLQPRPDETPLEALDRLVPATQTGAGTFGCLVNGEVWIPEVDGSSDVAADALVGISNPFSLEITSIKEPISDNRSQILGIGSEFSVGNFSNMIEISRFTDTNIEGNCRKIFIDITEKNYIQIENYDQENLIISGRFECTMREPDCPDTKIEITEGRFDLIYRF